MSLPFAVRYEISMPPQEAFVVDSWRHSFEQSPDGLLYPRDVYRAWQSERIGRLMARSTTLIATSTEEPITLGWVCAERRSSGRLVVHYAYVKSAYRGNGLGEALIEQARDALHADDRPGAYTHRRPPWTLAFERRGWRYRPDYARGAK